MIAFEYGWNVQAYIAGGGAHRPQTGDDQFASRLDLVDGSLQSGFWKGYWQMLKRVSCVLLDMIAWVERCHCHEGMLLHDESDTEDEDHGISW